MNWFRKIYSFDYMGHKYLWFAFSGTIIAIGLLSMFIRGGGNPAHGFNYGLEFHPGTRIATTLVKPATSAQLRVIVSAQGYSDAVIQQVQAKNGGSSFQISTRTLSADQQLALKDAINKAFQIAPASGGGSDWNISTVGATFDREVITASYKAGGIALILILIYVSLRTGTVVSITQTGLEAMDVTLTSNKKTSMHYEGTIESRSQVALVANDYP